MPNYFQIPPCITKLWVGHELVSVVYAQNVSAHCDLVLCPSDMVLVRDTLPCAKLSSNATMHNKIIDRTQTGFTEV